jgi:hypothetical protein
MESSSSVSVRNARRTGRPQGFLPPFPQAQNAAHSIFPAHPMPAAQNKELLESAIMESSTLFFVLAESL